MMARKIAPTLVLLCHKSFLASACPLRPQYGHEGRRTMSAFACRHRSEGMDAGLWRSGREGSAARLETFGYGSGLEEGKRLRGGKPSSLGREKRVCRDA